MTAEPEDPHGAHPSFPNIAGQHHSASGSVTPWGRRRLSTRILIAGPLSKWDRQEQERAVHRGR